MDMTAPRPTPAALLLTVLLALMLRPSDLYAQKGKVLLQPDQLPVVYTQSCNPPVLFSFRTTPAPTVKGKPGKPLDIDPKTVTDVSFSFMGQPLALDTSASLPTTGLYHILLPFIPYDTTLAVGLSINYTQKGKAKELIYPCQVKPAPLPGFALYIDDKPDSIATGNETVEIRMVPTPDYNHFVAQCGPDATLTLRRVKLGLQIADLPPQPFGALSFGPGQYNCPLQLDNLWQAYKMGHSTQIVLWIDQLERTPCNGVALDLARRLTPTHRTFVIKKDN